MVRDLISPMVAQIMNSAPNYESLEYSGVLHTTTDDFTLNQIDSLEFVQDYNNETGDTIFINFKIGLGDYVYDIKPNLHNLMLTLYRSMDGSKGPGRSFKAIATADRVTHGDVNGNYSREDLNTAEVIMVSFQLLDRPLEVFRSIPMDGIYNNTTLKDLLYTTINEGMNKVKIDGLKPTIKVNIEEPNNQRLYKQVIIPTGRLLLDIPTFLQDTKFGLYNGDICVYTTIIENEINIFICSQYTDIESDEEIYIYHSGSPLYDSIEVTHQRVGNMLKIVSASDMTMIENRETKYIDRGHAITHSDPEKILNYNAVISDDNIVYDKNTHIEGVMGYDKEDGLISERYVGHMNNMYAQRSKMIKDGLSEFQITWNFSNKDLLRPDLPYIFMFQKGGEIVKLRGRLQKAYTLYSGVNKTETTMLHITCRRTKDVEQNQ